MTAGARAKGADVSHFHPVVDWAALVGAVSFFGAKATQNRANVDPTFVAHRDGFRASGIPLGVYYHVLGADADPADQARRFAGVVGQLAKNERLCLDVERSIAVDASWYPRIDAFMTELLKGACGGTRPWLYVSAGAWKQIGNPLWDLASEVDLWVPRYSTDEPEVPRGWTSWLAWQCSEAATVPGIQGPCDASVFNGSDADVRAYASAGAATRVLVA